jgi:proline iminopeptidase
VHISLAGGYRPSPRFADPAFRAAFVRLVTPYFSNLGFMPADIAWQLTRDWSEARLEIVESGGHGTGHGMTDRVVAALDFFARV